MKIEIQQKYITLPELIVYLNVKENTLRDWIRLNKIPYSKVEGLLRFDKNKIEQWERQKQASGFKNQYA